MSPDLDCFVSEVLLRDEKSRKVLFLFLEKKKENANELRGRIFIIYKSQTSCLSLLLVLLPGLLRINDHAAMSVTLSS